MNGMLGDKNDKRERDVFYFWKRERCSLFLDLIAYWVYVKEEEI